MQVGWKGLSAGGKRGGVALTFCFAARRGAEPQPYPHLHLNTHTLPLPSTAPQKQHGGRTKVMASGLRTKAEALALAGCDFLVVVSWARSWLAAWVPGLGAAGGGLGRW